VITAGPSLYRTIADSVQNPTRRIGFRAKSLIMPLRLEPRRLKLAISGPYLVGDPSSR
jgi:hypothetical protein